MEYYNIGARNVSPIVLILIIMEDTHGAKKFTIK